MSGPILIVGGGNMGGALARRWRQAMVGPIHVVTRNPVHRVALSAEGMVVHATLSEAPPTTFQVLRIVLQRSFARLEHEWGFARDWAGLLGHLQHFRQPLIRHAVEILRTFQPKREKRTDI